MKAKLHVSLCASAVLSSTVALAELTVDLEQAIGPVTHRASGLLWSVTQDEPADELIKPLKIQKYRTRLTPWIKGSGIDSFQRMDRLGATIQVCLSGEYALRFKDREARRKTKGFGYHKVDVWPGDSGDFCSPKRQTSPGLNAMYLANLEVAGVNGACRACWRDHDGKLFNGWQPMLDGLLTPDQKPRSTWWVFKAYADLSGTLVKVMKGKWVHGIAGVSREDETVQILIGKNEYPPKDSEVVITGLKGTPYLFKAGAVRVVAQRIPNSGWRELGSPETLVDALRPVKDGKLSLSFPELAAHDALVIKLVRPQ